MRAVLLHYKLRQFHISIVDYRESNNVNYKLFVKKETIVHRIATLVPCNIYIN